MKDRNLNTAMSWLINGMWVKVKGNLGQCLAYRGADNIHSYYGNRDEVLVAFSDGKSEWYHIDNVEKVTGDKL